MTVSVNINKIATYVMHAEEMPDLLKVATDIQNFKSKESPYTPTR
jgi:hypothetical protein